MKNVGIKNQVALAAQLLSIYNRLLRLRLTKFVINHYPIYIDREDNIKVSRLEGKVFNFIFL